MTGVAWLTARSREHIECGVEVRRKLFWRSIGWLVSHAQHVYVEAERVLNERSRSLLTTAPYLRKWLSTLKTAVSGANSSLPPLVADEKATFGSR